MTTVNDVMALADAYAHGYDANPIRDEFNEERAALLAAVESMAHERDTLLQTRPFDGKAEAVLRKFARQLQDDKQKLAQELEAAKADAARIDWIESKSYPVFSIYKTTKGFKGYSFNFDGRTIGYEGSMREAIDAAMAAHKEQT